MCDRVLFSKFTGFPFLIEANEIDDHRSVASLAVNASVLDKANEIGI
jgi:hypothetical protein